MEAQNKTEARFSNFTQGLRQITTRLSELDVRRVVFGAKKHNYGFASPLSAKALADFEKRHALQLPTPYKRYLTELGNGGAGPFYGIEPLSVKAEASYLLEDFPNDQPFEIDHEDSLPGAIHITEYGCGIELLLVVRGTCAGQVWWDARYEGGVEPMTGRKDQRVTFDTYCIAVLKSDLERFEILLQEMKKGVDHDLIHERWEKNFSQFDIDKTMLSIMDCDPDGKPTKYRDKPWGGVCGLVDDHYSRWRERNVDCD